MLHVNKQNNLVDPLTLLSDSFGSLSYLKEGPGFYVSVMKLITVCGFIWIYIINVQKQMPDEQSCCVRTLWTYASMSHSRCDWGFHKPRFIFTFDLKDRWQKCSKANWQCSTSKHSHLKPGSCVRTQACHDVRNGHIFHLQNLLWHDWAITATPSDLNLKAQLQLVI